VDAIFFRANGGTVRFDIATGRPHYVSPMRPDCFDGVIVANGLLYWWPSVCDCQLTLYGVTCLGPAGNFPFYAPAREEERLAVFGQIPEEEKISAGPADWPTFRADNERFARIAVELPRKKPRTEEIRIPGAFELTPPIVVGKTIYLADGRGVLYAYDTEGRERWRFYTGGTVRISPTYWRGRIYVGSGDGYVWCLASRDGRPVWRFRAAPTERLIPVYGRILSTWPAASGVLVAEGVAYAAAGLANYDNIYVFALDAESGRIKWQNTTSGHLNREARTGPGVQGHLLLHGGKLYLAGGNAVSPAIYDIRDGRILNSGEKLNICESIALRGWELYLIGDRVAVGGQPFWRDPVYPVVDPTVKRKLFHVPCGDRDIVWENDEEVRCYPPLPREALTRSVRKRTYPGHHIIPDWGRLKVKERPFWSRRIPRGAAIAVGKNALILAAKTDLFCLSLKDGRTLWQLPLPAEPVRWGLALGRGGLIVVALKGGKLLILK